MDISKGMFLCLIMSACSKSPPASDPEVLFSQDAIRASLRDPASAEFRKEEIRILWTIEDRRLKLYCGEVNSANAFGRRTGFKPVEVVLEYKILAIQIQLYGNGAKST